MKDEGLFEKLRDKLKKGDVKESSNLLITICKKYGEDWITYIKLKDILPEPLSHKFSMDTIVTFMKATKGIIGEVEIKYIEDTLRLLFSLMQLYCKIEKINKRLSKSKFFDFSPAKQIQMLCTLIEDQSRIAEKELLEHTKEPDVITGMDFIRADMEHEITGEKISIIDNVETMADAIDLNLRYIFWRYKKDLDGIPFKDVSPYNSKPFHELCNLAYIRLSIGQLWQNVKYRHWKCFTKDDVTYYCPPDVDLYIKEEASVNRYRLYINELLNYALLNSFTSRQFDSFQNMISEIEVDISSSPWRPDVPVGKIRELLSLFTPFEVLLTEVFHRLYKKSIGDLLFGPSNKRVNGEDFLKACKFIFVLSSIYENKSWKSINFDDESQYHSLIPVINETTLVDIFSQVTRYPEEKCINTLNLLSFNPENTKLDIWSQPLVPIGKGNYLLIPIIGKTMNLIRLFESHILQWNIGFHDRGPLFEEKIRDKFRKAKIPVVSHSIEFQASDGKKVEYDIVAWFKDYLVLVEAKCLRNPYSPIDKYNSWEEVNNGIEQLKRRRNLIHSDWNRIRGQADIGLPLVPPEKHKILCMLIINIFTFTGVEVDNIRVSDLTCFDRYLSGGTIEGIKFNKKGIVTRFIAERIWAGKEPTPMELWNYIHNPPGLRNIIDKAKIQFSGMPLLDKEDESKFCIPNVIVGS